jgi:alkylated DNA repair dioxygenase AlkB
MDLFDDPALNLLPYDGTVFYHGLVMTPAMANLYYENLLENIAWQHDEAYIFGKHFITPRKVAWYGDDAYQYTYSNATKTALPWTPALMELKALATKHTGTVFNSCLLNLYHNGNEGMAWHSDDEKSLGQDTTIASFSLGAERNFLFKHKKTGERVAKILEHGSLLVMTGTTQSHWLHRLPPTKKIKGPRINLTFRTIIDQG